MNANDSGTTLFQRMALVRADVIHALKAAEHIHDAIKGPSLDSDGYDQASDLRAQLKEAIRDLYSARDYLKPLEEHIDQQLPSAAVIPFRRAQSVESPKRSNHSPL
jgi:hypothetical protein